MLDLRSYGRALWRAQDKKSDLKSVGLGPPKIWKGWNGEEKAIQGLNSALLKFDQSICTKCNNETTQRADRAYERYRRQADAILRNILQAHTDEINIAQTPVQKAEYLDLIRYFGKHLGCVLKYSYFPIPRRLARFVGLRSAEACVNVTIRSAPFVWCDDETGEVGPISGIGGVVLVGARMMQLPGFYRTAFMNRGYQFIVTLDLTLLESLEIAMFHRRGMGRTVSVLEPDQAKHLGFPSDD